MNKVIENLSKGSARRVQEYLTIFQKEIQAIRGEYSWFIEGNTFQGYKITAHSGKDIWTESSGKTPRKALHEFFRFFPDNDTFHEAKRIAAA